MLPGTQFTAPPPTTPGEVGAGARTPGDVTTPGLPIVPGLDTPGLVVPGVVRAGFVVVALGGVPPADELPMEDPGVVPVIGCGVPNRCGVEPNVPVIGAPVPGVPPMFGLLTPCAVLESMVGERLNVPEPVIGAGPTPGVGPNVPVVPDGATGDMPVVPGAAPTAPVPPAAPGAAVW